MVSTVAAQAKQVEVVNTDKVCRGTLMVNVKKKAGSAMFAPMWAKEARDGKD